jgi:hypothetical protein
MTRGHVDAMRTPEGCSQPNGKTFRNNNNKLGMIHVIADEPLSNQRTYVLEQQRFLKTALHGKIRSLEQTCQYLHDYLMCEL